ncbi:hypothetical protein [Candidatus Leptofilum sp.]|uniref:hypothetical protein n=1 Tax=Candidatus Leptofilum sp. TaxID=3241576 RepID=UPI003B5ABAD8
MNEEQKPKPGRNKKIYTFFIFLELLVVFIAGIFGDQLANSFQISTGTIIVGTVLCLALLYLVTLTRINLENNNSLLPKSLRKFTPSKIVTLFPATILIGMLVTFISISLLENELMRIPGLGKVWTYEILSYLICFIFLYRISVVNRDFLTVFLCSVGFSLGIAAITLLMRPFDNHPLATMGFGFIVALLLTLILRSSAIQKMFTSVSQAIRGE